MKRLTFATLVGFLVLIRWSGVHSQEANQAALSFGGGGTNASASTTVETDEFTGALTYKVEIPVPPARGNITPSLVLNYHSHRRNLDSWVGNGWELDLGAIIRTPEDGHMNYITGRGFEARFGGQSESLTYMNTVDDLSEYGIDLSSGQRAEIFRAKNESSYTFFFHVLEDVPFIPRVDRGWIAIEKSGNRYFFGRTPASRETPSSEAGPLALFRTSRWMLDRVTDANGNELRVTYGSDDKLPEDIEYQDIRIHFNKGSAGGADNDIAYFPIFREEFVSRIEMFRVLKSIVVLKDDRRIQRFALSYQTSNLRRVRQLQSLQQFGTNDSESLPPVTFDYFGEEALSFSSSSFDKMMGHGDYNGMMNEGATLADMNGDGLVDHVLANEDGTFEVYFNNGNDFVLIPGESHWTDPFPCGGPDIGDGDDPPCRGKLNAFRRDSGDNHQWLFLMDINGDGLPDRIGRVNTPAGFGFPETANFRIAFNTGHGWDPDSVEWKDPYQGSWAGTADRGKGFADMNGDGLVDRIWGDRDEGRFRVYYNTGAGFKNDPVYWTDPLSQHGNINGKGRLFDAEDDGKKTYVSIRDMNGDGLPDRVLRTTLIFDDGSEREGFEVSLNTRGTGWAQPEPIPGEPGNARINGYDTIAFVDPVAEVDSRGYLDEKHDLIDVNGDGFLDRVEGDSDSCEIRFFVYRGMIRLERFPSLSSAVVLRDPVWDPAGVDEDWKACGYLAHKNGDDNFVFFQDLNGDNLPDRFASRRRDHDRGPNNYVLHALRLNDVTFSDSPSWWENDRVSQPIGALSEVIDGRGQRMAVEYQPSTWRRDDRRRQDRFLPFNLNLVRKIYTLDPTLAGPSSIPEAMRHPGMRWTSYLFRGGNFFVRHAVKSSPDIEDDGIDRPFFSRFNGFQEVRKRTVWGPGENWLRYATTTRFYQALGDVDPWVGDGGGIFDAGGYTHFALSGRPYLQMVVEDGGREAARLTSRWEVNGAGGSNFDCTGPPGEVSLCFPLLVSQTKLSREEEAGTPRVSRTDYEYDNFGNPTIERSFDGDTLLLSKETTYYPPETFGTLFIRDRPSLQIKKDARDVVYRKKEFAYDSRGNPQRETFFTDEGGDTVSITRDFDPGTGNLTHITDTDGVTKGIEYDAEGRFPIRETVTTPAGDSLTTTRSFNRLTGEIAEERNPQGVGKRIQRDAFGRPLEEYVVTAGGAETLTRIYRYWYLPFNVDGWDDVTLLVTHIWEPQPDYPLRAEPTSITYQDASGQTLQQCILSERGNYRLVQNRLQNGGREEIQTEPRFADDCSTFLSTIPDGVRVTRKFKDLMGRDLRIESPPGEAESPVGPVAISYATNGDGHLVKTTTNARRQTTVESFDGNERSAEIRDPAGTITRYQYNPVGDLLQVTGGGTVLSTITYDLMGRKTGMVDADMGHWQYRYDSLGRLERQIDNKGQQIRYSYDTLGRITQKESYGTGEVLEKREVYTYDHGEDGFNLLPGELFQVEEFDSGGSSLRRTRYGYDPDFRRTDTIARLLPSVGEFRQRLTHDFLGKVRQSVFPGGHTLQYAYMLNGNLQSVACSSCPAADGDSYYRIDPDTAFDVFGALLREDYGDGSSGEYQYFPSSHRLQRKRILQGGTVLSERTYQYDEAANIRRIDDPLDARGSGGLSGTDYDSLDRLTGYTRRDGVAPVLRYDPSGNILQNSASYGDQEYRYESPRPHAVTRIGDKRFEYDENGNMTSDPDRRMTYNAQNQLARVDMTNGDVVAYDYDYTGARVKKTATKTDPYHRITQATTHYLGDALEVRGDQMILNVYAGSRRVVTRTIGSLGDAGIGGGTLVDRGIDPVLNPTLAMPGLFMLATLFLLGSLRPVPLRIPVWAWKGRHMGLPLQRAFRRIYLDWRSWRRMVQETLTVFPQRSFAKAFILFFALLSILQPPTLLFAGDEGVPETPPSDSDFFYYHHDDHLGSSHILTEGKTTARHAGVTYRRGEILQRFEYAPFGQETFALNPNLKFDPSYTGQMYDIETGLYYYKSRYYNPVLARFIQPDTVVPEAGNLQAYNRYSYVSNNPLKYDDPTGHFWFLIAMILAGAAFGATMSAIFGGNILLGALQGAITAAIFFGAGSVIQAVEKAGTAAISAVAQAAIHAVAGAVAGAINTAIAGGSLAQIGRGSLVGAISAGAAKYAGKFLDHEHFFTQLFGRSMVGAATGAVASVISGGDPWKGALTGAAYAAAGTVFNEFAHEAIKKIQEMRARVSQVRLFGGFRLAGIPGMGGEGTAGAFYRPFAASPLDRYGVFGLGGGGFGVEGSLGVEGGVINGSLESESINVNVSGNPFGGSLILDSSSYNPVGVTGGLGVGGPFGVSATRTTGGEYTLRNLIQSVWP